MSAGSRACLAAFGFAEVLGHCSIRVGWQSDGILPSRRSQSRLLHEQAQIALRKRIVQQAPRHSDLKAAPVPI